MRIRKVKDLLEEEIKKLKKGQKSGTDMRYRIRCRMMLEMHVNKKTIQDLSEMFSVGREAVSTWLNRYESQGIEGLRDLPKSGRPIIDKDKLMKKI